MNIKSGVVTAGKRKKHDPMQRQRDNFFKSNQSFPVGTFFSFFFSLNVFHLRLGFLPKRIRLSRSGRSATRSLIAGGVKEFQVFIFSFRICKSASMTFMSQYNFDKKNQFGPNKPSFARIMPGSGWP